MSFPADIKEQVLIACARHCCICHRFCGIKIELHHIKQKAEGGKDTADNCIPLCFDCHGDMRSYDHKHPKGTKYTASELIKHRDTWYGKVREAPVFTYSTESADLDRKALARLKELLPPLNSIGFIRQNNFAGFGFRRSNLDDFPNYLAECEDPAFEFIDAELEAMRADCHQHPARKPYFAAASLSVALRAGRCASADRSGCRRSHW